MILSLCVAFQVAGEMRLVSEGLRALRAREVSDVVVQLFVSVEGAVMEEALATDVTGARLKNNFKRN